MHGKAGPAIRTVPQPPQPGARRQKDGRVSEPSTFERIDVLIADPNRHMRTLLKGVLRAFGVRSIREANDGADAFKEMSIGNVDLVLTEYMMSPLDGLDFVRLVRTGQDSSDRFMPVIMVSGHTERHIVEQARDAGINEFLAKPITPESLMARTLSVLEHPRPFVHVANYFGPDRRRRNTRPHKGDRRKKQTPLTPITPLSERLHRGKY